jgi:hypothetical protein
MEAMRAAPPQAYLHVYVLQRIIHGAQGSVCKVGAGGEHHITIPPHLRSSGEVKHRAIANPQHR